MRVQNALRLQKERKSRQRLSAMRAFAAAPGSGALTLPVGGRFSFRSLASKTLGSPVASITGARVVNLVAPAAMVAGSSLTVDWLPPGSIITLEVGYDLYFAEGGYFTKVASRP